jgi:hypothetical protein
MYLRFGFQFGFRIAFRLVQADQSVELVDSPLTSLRYTCGKNTFFVCRTKLKQKRLQPRPYVDVALPFLSGDQVPF